MRVKDVSTHTLVRIEPGVTLRMAAVELAQHEVGVLAVEDSRGVGGVLSERDLARAIADEADLDLVQVRDYMTTSSVTTSDEAPVEEAIGLMHEHGLRHVILERGGEIDGVISARDILRMLAPDVTRIIQV
jgi:CBS domain-containing protein